MSVLRQAVGFAVFGAVVAVFATGASDGSWSTAGDTVVMLGGDTLGDDGTHPAWIGAAAGAVTGLFLSLIGTRTHGRPGERIGTVVAAGLAGAVIGLTPALVVAGVAFAGGPSPTTTVPPLLIYAASGLLAYAASLGAVRTILQRLGDRHLRSTVLTLAWVLPLGAAAATAAGIWNASLSDFSTSRSTWITTTIVVVVILAAAFASARALAVRATPDEPASEVG